MKKTNLEAKFTKSSENFSKLKGKTQNFEKNLKNSSKKLKVSANPLGLLAENRSKKKPGVGVYVIIIFNYFILQYLITNLIFN